METTIFKDSDGRIYEMDWCLYCGYEATTSKRYLSKDEYDKLDVEFRDEPGRADHYNG